jgi:RNA polymerase sigma factor (sigma-70 family)
VSCTDPQPNENKCSADEIYEAYSSFIYRTICYHIKDESQVEDLFQEFYLHLTTYPPPQNLKNIEAFLYRSISNFIIGFRRRQKEYRARLRCYGLQGLPRKKEDRPEKAVIDAEETQKIFTLIENLLPTRESAAITERYKHDREIDDVAKILEVNVRSVSRYVSSGLSKIQKLFLVGGED